MTQRLAFGLTAICPVRIRCIEVKKNKTVYRLFSVSWQFLVQFLSCLLLKYGEMSSFGNCLISKFYCAMVQEYALLLSVI